MEKIKWPSKVPPALIERAYREDAAGFRDETLVGDLGIRLLLRCQAILRAMRGDVECPRCGREFNVVNQTANPPDDTATCAAGCGWQTTRQAFLESKKNRDLNGADSVVEIFSAFVKEYPACRAPRDKILRIDRLIHEFHWNAIGLPNRSLSNNLIEGSHKQVIAFLDNLSGVDPAAKEHWRDTVDLMWRRRRGHIEPQ